MYKICKEFQFDYGHRVWSQELNVKLSLDNQCKCRHLHGHRGLVGVELVARELKDGMVTDFKHLNFFKKFIDDVVDHKFIVDRNDPLFSRITSHEIYGLLSCGFYSKIDCDGQFMGETLRGVEREQAESFVVVDFVPTSENLCKWFYEILVDKLKGTGITVSKVYFKETPSSYSEYKPNVEELNDYIK